MPNLRIIYDNRADAATVTASTTSGTLVAANMQTDYKGQCHRSTGTSVSYTLTWASDQTVRGVALPCTNLTSTATWRIRLYNSSDVVIADSTAITAVTGLNLNLNSWTTRNVNSFFYGGASKSTYWFASSYTTVRKCVIDLVDTSNPAGYIDCSRVVVGDYWSPQYNVDKGMTIDVVDNSAVERRDSGDFAVDRKFLNDTISFSFGLMTDSDRNELLKIIKLAGITKNILVSVLPGNSSQKAEQDFTLYGKRNNSGFTYLVESFYSHQMTLESW